MQGRLEHQLKIENNINNILKILSPSVSDYYYNISSYLEPKTCEEYIKKVRNFLLYIDKDLIDVNESDLTRYLHSISTKNINGEITQCSFSYRKMVHTVMNSFFTYLYNTGKINTNPMKNISRPKNLDHVKRIEINKEDVSALVSISIKGAGTDEQKARQNNWKTRDNAIISLLAMTGMRRTALTEINLSDLDIDKGELIVTDKRHKTIKYHISNKLKDILLDWIEDRNNKVGSNVDALFISNQRKRISANSVSEIVKKYSNEALGYEISPHKLRSAFCTILYQSTGDIELVRDAVGHSNITTTQRYIVKDDYSKIKSSEIMESEVL